MSNLRLQKQDMDFLIALKGLTQSYQEISVMRMQGIRQSVLKTRAFMLRMSEIFFDVRESYRHQVDSALTLPVISKKKQHVFGEAPHRRKEAVAVFVAASNRLYGDITNRVCGDFVKHVAKTEPDVVIIGRLGRELFLEQLPNYPFTFFDISEGQTAAVDLPNIVSQLTEYNRVDVFYGKFENMIRQVPATSDIAGGHRTEAQLLTQPRGDLPHVGRRFLFEPSLPETLAFFEKQVFASLFKQTVNESHLATFASRVKAMEDALRNIETSTNQMAGQIKRTQRMIVNKKQIETLTRVTHRK